MFLTLLLLGGERFQLSSWRPLLILQIVLGRFPFRSRMLRTLIFSEALSFRDAYSFLRSTAPIPWACHLWGLHIPLRIFTFV